MNELLQCASLKKNYGNTPALKGIDLTITSGKFIGLLGPNGSGKTTLLKLAAGILTPTSGNLTICGMPIGAKTKSMTSFLPDANYLPETTILNIVDYFADFYQDFDRTKALTMLRDLKLDTAATPKKLSKGNREKLQLILAMSRRARLYLLDEPIGGIDPAARDYILNTILANYAEDASVLLSTHLIGDIEQVLDEAIFLREGEILAHREVDELRETEGKSVDEYFREVFKC